MIFQVFAWVILAGVAQPWAPSSPALPETPSPVFRIIAVEASNDGHEESSVDDEAAGLRDLLKDLPFDTFRVVTKNEQAAPLGIDTVIPISAEYRFHVVPSAYRPDSGEVELRARVEMLENQRAVNALAADGVAVPGKALVFRGFPLKGREMAVIMTLIPPEKDQGQSPGEDENQVSRRNRRPNSRKNRPQNKRKPANVNARIRSVTDRLKVLRTWKPCYNLWKKSIVGSNKKCEKGAIGQRCARSGGDTLLFRDTV